MKLLDLSFKHFLVIPNLVLWAATVDVTAVLHATSSEVPA